ncbi:hypothetical protein BDR07DRAFT_1482265 [Suillus spraguei]|nr:hypothetical protein BDR07DRAFT_1482265 [Suillus spraguei]
MTIVLNDPALWPFLNANICFSYFAVAAFVIVMYDWALTFGQEVELVWRQHWSLITFMYFGVRYLGILYVVTGIPENIPTIPLTDTNWTVVVVIAMLWVIITTRLYAMYQQSRNILIFLIVTSLVVNIFGGAVTVLSTMNTSGVELVISGSYQCSLDMSMSESSILNSMIWILVIAWEALALCLTVWIAVKHLRELRRYPVGGIMRDCFTVLMKTHMLYFVSVVAASCLQAIFYLSSTLSTDASPMKASIYGGFLDLSQAVQMFVLGPRLILSIREHHAKLVADSDAATAMTSIAFQGRVHISTGSSV